MPQRTRKTARPSSLPAVTGSAKLLRTVGTVGPEKNRVGEIIINEKRYYCRVTDTAYQLFTFDERKGQPSHYDVDAECKTCDCPDFTARAHRRADGRCKHQKALAALIAAGKLPAVTPPACTPAVEIVDYDDERDAYDDTRADAMADADADAWHSQWDAA